MRIDVTRSDAIVCFDESAPAHLVWRDTRWDVLDRPTRIGLDEDAACSPFATHPPAPWKGWRFIARAEGDAETYVFDVRVTTAGTFEVVHVYD